MKREHGATTTIYHVKNNFEEYTTLEPVSQDYVAGYVIHCMTTMGMKLNEVKHTVREEKVFIRNTRVGTYGG